MTISYKTAVQDVDAQYVEFDFGDLPSGVFAPLVELPPGSIVQPDSAILVITASDAATSEALAVGTAASANVYGSVANSKTAGRTGLTASASPTTGRTVIGVTRTAVGAQTAGHYGLLVEYVTAGRSEETQGVASPT